MRSTLILLALLSGCSAAAYRDYADRQVYGILETAAEGVSGQKKVFPIDRPVDTLRRQIEEQPEIEVVIDLPTALDVAAENSRDFQLRKERLYRVGLALTLQLRNFYWIPTGGTSPFVAGTGDEQAVLDLRSDLAASRNTESGGRVVASFVNSFLKDLINGGSFNGSSILGLTVTQPLMAGFGKRIAREPLNQAERNVIYEMRSFERFRNTFAVGVTSEYYRVLQQFKNLDNLLQNVEGTRTNRELVEALVEAGRMPGVDLDRAKQQEYTANDAVNAQQAAYQRALDSFKVTLGLPTDARITLEPRELLRLRDQPIEEISLPEPAAIELALSRRFDHRTVIDNVVDTARRVRVAEDALRSILDFSGAIAVPTDPGSPLKFDWDRVDWSVGFDLDLALERLPQRNAYRSALIDLEANIRAREQSEDAVKQEVREALRSLRRTYTSFGIQSDALELSERRLVRADDFLQAGRGNTLALLDAQSDLLAARLNVTRAIVDYAVAKLELLRDLEGLVLEPKGLRYDPGLPLPTATLVGAAAGGRED